MRLFKPNVAKLHAKRDIAGLVKALSHRNPAVASAALEALIDLGLGADLLMTAQAQGAGDFWKEILRRLGDDRSPRVLEALIAGLRGEFDIAMNAAYGLADVDPKRHGEAAFERVVEGLLSALANPASQARASMTHAARGWVSGLNDPALRTRIVEALLEVTEDGNKYESEAVVEALVEIGAPAAEPLLAFLSKAGKSGRRAAVKSLGKIGDPRGLEALGTALRDADAAVRRAALEALLKVGDPRAAESLTAALGDPEEAVRLAAVETLVKVGGARARQFLPAALTDAGEKVRQAAAAALDGLGWRPEADVTGAFFWATRGEWDRCVEIGAPAVKALILALSAANREERKDAAHALGRIGDPQALEALGFALADPVHVIVFPWGGSGWDQKDLEVREAVIGALGRIGGVRAAELLGAVLTDLPEPLEEQAATALAALGEAAVPALLAAAGRERGELAAGALAELGAPVVDSLIAAAGSKSGLPGKGAARALRRVRDKAAVEPLVSALAHPVRRVREAAAQALGSMQAGAAVAALIPVLQDRDRTVRCAAAEALGRIGDARAAEPLIAVLGDRDPAVRCAAAEALGRLGDPRAVEPLAAALAGDEWAVRTEALKALAGLGWRPGSDAAAAACYVIRRDWGKCMELGVLAADPLLEACKHGIEGAAETLAHMGDARAVDPLLPWLHRGELYRRRMAAEALVHLYWLGRLDEASKRKILAAGDSIRQPHGDHYRSHDCAEHDDVGIGIHFDP